MTVQRIGAFIAEKRKAQQITQSELAEKMGVTDKAVSKWERNLSYPDITLLPKLADILGVTVDELLGGKQNETTADTARKGMIQRLANYARITNKQMVHQFAFVSVSIVFIVTIAAALIVNSAVQYGTDNDILWSPYVIGGVVVLWLPYAILAYAKRAKFVLAASTFGVLLTGYALLIERMTNTEGWVRDIYLPMLGVVAISLAAIVTLLCKKVNGWFVASAILLLVGGVSFVADFLADRYVLGLGGTAPDSIGEFINLVTVISLLGLSAFTATIGLLARSNNANKN